MKLTKLQEQRLRNIIDTNYKLLELADGDQNEAHLIEAHFEHMALFDIYHDETLRMPVDPIEFYGEDVVKQMLGVSTYEALEEGNMQARVIADIAPFQSGEDVHIQLIDNDMVAVTSIDERKYEEYNLDTHEDYDKYFRVY